MPSYGGTEPQWFGICFTFRQLTHVMSPNGRTSSAAAVRMKNPAVHGVTECGHRRESANGRFVEAKLTNPVPPRAAALEQPEGPVWVAKRKRTTTRVEMRTAVQPIDRNHSTRLIYLDHVNTSCLCRLSVQFPLGPRKGHGADALHCSGRRRLVHKSQQAPPITGRMEDAHDGHAVGARFVKDQMIVLSLDPPLADVR